MGWKILWAVWIAFNVFGIIVGVLSDYSSKKKVTKFHAKR